MVISSSERLLSDDFPLRFNNGHTIDTLAFWCVKCGAIAQDTQVYGQISRIVPYAADIRASYLCRCGHVNSYRIRLKDDKSFSFLADGSWREQVPRSRTFMAKLRHWLRIMVGYLKFKWGCFLLLRNLKKLHQVIHKYEE